MLQYLNQHAGGSGARTSLDPSFLTHQLGISAAQFAEDSKALAATGFVGVRDFRPNGNDVPSLRCSTIWITGKGEAYLRGLKQSPAQATPLNS